MTFTVLSHPTQILDGLRVSFRCLHLFCDNLNDDSLSWLCRIVLCKLLELMATFNSYLSFVYVFSIHSQHPSNIQYMRDARINFHGAEKLSN